MLEKTEAYINELLEEDEKYQELEGQICELIPQKWNKEKGTDENIDIYNELQSKIIEKAYLKGYSDGMKEFDKIREHPEKYLRLDQIHKLNEEIGITQKNDPDHQK